MHRYMNQKTCTRMFTTAVFLRAKYEQTSIFSVVQRIDNCGIIIIYNEILYSTKINKLLISATTRVKLKLIIK